MNHAKNALGISFLVCLSAAMLAGWEIQPSFGGPPSGTPAGPVVPVSIGRIYTPGAALVGKTLFADTTLSNPTGLACASCHVASAGFKYADQNVNRQSGIPPGSVKGRFENRIPPTISYAMFLPAGPPHFTGTVEAFTGGLFWDGRAANLTAQVPFPLENPNEMNDTVHNVGDPATVVRKVRYGPSASIFKQVYGNTVFSQDTTTVFNLIVSSIVAYESSPEVSPFSSKYDSYIHGVGSLTASELRGLRLVTGSTTGRPGGPATAVNAHCVDCHGIPVDSTTGPDIWTNSCYDNIGVPKNPANPYYKMTDPQTNPAGFNPQGAAYLDLGLGGAFYPFQYNLPPGNIGTGSNGQGDFLGINGDFKAPTLRNVDKRPNSGFVKRYMHNGFFTDLKSIVHFYNTRNLTTCPGEVIDFTAAQPYANLKGKPLWPTPEYPSVTTLQNASGAPNSQGAQVGNLLLTDSQENDIVAFLKTLTDGYGASYATTTTTVTTATATPSAAKATSASAMPTAASAAQSAQQNTQRPASAGPARDSLRSQAPYPVRHR